MLSCLTLLGTKPAANVLKFYKFPQGTDDMAVTAEPVLQKGRRLAQSTITGELCLQPIQLIPFYNHCPVAEVRVSG